MFKLLLQLGLITAALGVAKNSFDTGSLNLQSVSSAIQQFATTANNSSIPGAQEVASAAQEALSALNSAQGAAKVLGDKATSATTSQTTDQAATVNHAFYTRPSRDCATETTINLETGAATCAEQAHN